MRKKHLGAANVKVMLEENEIPRQWYNLAADLPTPLQPPLGPDGMPVTPEALSAVFPMNLIEQEVSSQRWIDIPEAILEILYRWRPTPLQRATLLENKLNSPARIYFKNESVSPAGSHKPNTAVAQAWYNKQFGIRRLCTETGAGQWGSALAFACSLHRPGVQGLHGQMQLRAKAIPQSDDGNLGSHLCSQPKP